MGSEIDDLFNEFMKWDLSQIKSIWYHEGKIGNTYVEAVHEELNFQEKRLELIDIWGKMEENSNLRDDLIAKLIILKYFLFVDSEINMKDKEDPQIVIDAVKELLIGDGASEVPGEISKMQLFTALDCVSKSKKEIVKVTWANVTSEWGPKVILKDAKKYYYLFNNKDNFEELMVRYNIAAKLGDSQVVVEYFSEKILGGVFVLVAAQETNDCKTLDVRFREADGAERKKLFEGVMRAYFRHPVPDKEIEDKAKFRYTFPRLKDDEFGKIGEKMGHRILLSTPRVASSDTMIHHIVHTHHRYL